MTYMLTMMRWCALQEQDLYVKGQGHTWSLKRKTEVNTSLVFTLLLIGDVCVYCIGSQ